MKLLFLTDDLSGHEGFSQYSCKDTVGDKSSNIGLILLGHCVIFVMHWHLMILKQQMVFIEKPITNFNFSWIIVVLFYTRSGRLIHLFIEKLVIWRKYFKGKYLMVTLVLQTQLILPYWVVFYELKLSTKGIN